MDPVIAALLENGFSARLISFSALDRFCGLRPAEELRVETSADLAELSRLFDGLRFPGPDIADAALDREEGERGRKSWYFRCDEGSGGACEPVFDALTLSWDAARKIYLDPNEVYPIARALRDGARRETDAPAWHELRRSGAGRHRAAAEAALILSRYKGAAPDGESAGEAGQEAAIEAAEDPIRRLPEDAPLPREEQRLLLSGLMASRRPQLGLELLKRTGFIASHWPELAALDEVDHSKEHHPEGNVWRHTLETFRYRKIPDPVLSLGLLLHDSGKPIAEASGGRRFDRHAELGERTARAFLGRLGFPAARTEEVAFLVRNHMLPAALPRLPLTRTQAALESPLFPLLLELYRCDESSSFKDQGGFYESCAAYRSYLRNVKNPYRSADGKKLMKLLFS